MYVVNQHLVFEGILHSGHCDVPGIGALAIHGNAFFPRQAWSVTTEVEHIAEPRELENQIEEMEVEVVEIRHREALKQIKSRLDMAQLESAVVS